MGLNTVGDVLLVAGSAWMLLAAIGVVRLPDVYSRMHAITKASTLGLVLVLAGAAAHLRGEGAIKLILVSVFVFVTAPVGAHLVSRAVTSWPGLARIRIGTVNELEDDTRSDADTDR